jgi:predicted transport protein
MKNWMYRRTLFACLVCYAIIVPRALSQDLAVEGAIEAEIVKVAQLRMPVFEDTKKARNFRLNELFKDYVQRLGGEVTVETIKRFNAMLSRQGLTNFDDFMTAEMKPLRYVRDPASGEQIPVLGALGSDLINPWLAAAGVAEGKPLGEQPMYHAAAYALREHVDFALIGIKDPNLSPALLPPELRENAEWAYRRLNPGNEFDGGFDHALFYATVREAAKKLFRQDYPEAKMTMAQLVVPEDQGGFGIRSCLLCHNQDHTGVYERLLGQGLYFEAKAAEIREGNRGYSKVGTAMLPRVEAQIRKAKAQAATFQQAAQIVLDTFPDNVDAEAARSSLAMLSLDNLTRLKPGYSDFSRTLKRLGCLKCHSTDSKVTRTKRAAAHGAFALNPNAYYKTKNIKALYSLIDLNDLHNSKLLLKAANNVKHMGAKDVRLDAVQVKALHDALAKWLYRFKVQQEKREMASTF